MTYLRYLIAFAVLLGVCLGGVVGFNLLVDPYGCYRVVTVTGFNRIKSRSVDRVGKSVEVACKDHDAMSFGTSRVALGYPRHHPAWEGYKHYNFAFAGALIGEVRYALAYAHRQHRLRRVLIGLDLFAFNDERFPAEFYHSFMNPARKDSPGFFENTMTWPVTRRSIETVEDNSGQAVSGLLMEAAGGKQRNTYDHYRLFRERMEGYMNQGFLFGDFHLRPDAMEALAQIIAFCRREGIDLRLVINPAHAMMMEVIRYRGLWPLYEDWKRQVAALAWGDGSHPVPLYDFTGYNAYTSERVPPKQKPPGVMQWYLEITHFKPALGKLVLDRAFGPEDAPPVAPGFGVRLTPDNVERHLAAIRAQRPAYVASHPMEMGWLAELDDPTVAARSKAAAGGD